MTKQISKPETGSYFLELGMYLRKKRTERDLTQVEVAKQLGYSSQFIANWERGVSSPPMPALKKIVEIYKISEKEFLSEMLQIQESYYKRFIFNKGKKKKTV